VRRTVAFTIHFDGLPKTQRSGLCLDHGA